MAEIKVTDRRMFAPDGTLREEFEREFAEAARAPQPEPASAAVVEPPRAPEPPPEPARPPAPLSGAPPGAADWFASAPENPPPGLLELAEFLAGWALASMGDVPLPDGRLVRDLDAAKFYIDLLGKLYERWASRLAPQEARFLEGYLDQLRLRYVSRRG